MQVRWDLTLHADLLTFTTVIAGAAWRFHRDWVRLTMQHKTLWRMHQKEIDALVDEQAKRNALAFRAGLGKS